MVLSVCLCWRLSVVHAVQLAMLFPSCFFGQMACGAVFGIVPFLSHRRSGLTIGVVAAGGNVGAAVMQVGAGWHQHSSGGITRVYVCAWLPAQAWAPATCPYPCIGCSRPCFSAGGCNHCCAGFVVQALFFGVVELTPYEGFYWMGAAVICLGALSCLLLYWPM